jgi:hypothetical protein
MGKPIMRGNDRAGMGVGRPRGGTTTARAPARAPPSAPRARRERGGGAPLPPLPPPRWAHDAGAGELPEPGAEWALWGPGRRSRGSQCGVRGPGQCSGVWVHWVRGRHSARPAGARGSQRGRGRHCKCVRWAWPGAALPDSASCARRRTAPLRGGAPVWAAAPHARRDHRGRPSNGAPSYLPEALAVDVGQLGVQHVRVSLQPRHVLVLPPDLLLQGWGGCVGWAAWWGQGPMQRRRGRSAERLGDDRRAARSRARPRPPTLGPATATCQP